MSTSLQDSNAIYSNMSDDLDMAELIEEFVGCLSVRAAAIQEAVQASNLTEVTRLAHQLKGAGGAYGFDEITVVGAELEAACKASQSVSQVEKEVAQLVDLCLRAKVRPAS